MSVYMLTVLDLVLTRCVRFCLNVSILEVGTCCEEFLSSFRILKQLGFSYPENVDIRYSNHEGAGK